MSAPKVSMHLVKEVLRLTAAGLSQRQIARSLHLSHGVVGKYQAAAQRARLSWPLPEALDDDALANQLCTKPPQSSCAPASAARVVTDFAYIHEQLKQKEVTRLLLWEEYRAAHPDDSYGYSQFCFHYQQWQSHLKLVMRQTHRAGEKLFIDYAGPTVPIVNPITGEIREAQIFVAVLGASNYTYAEATWTQGLADWIGAHTRAFSFFGGVPALVVPDNPRSGVTKACRYEPLLNTSYHQMLAHYGTAALPARPYKPRDKAKVEVAVQVVERWILARLRHRTFHSLFALNLAIRELLTALNKRPFVPCLRKLMSMPNGAKRASVSTITWRSTSITTACRIHCCGNNSMCASPKERWNSSSAVSAWRCMCVPSDRARTPPNPSTCRKLIAPIWSGRRGVY